MRARRSSALIAGAAAFAAAPGLALADGGGAPAAVETASAVTILVPGKAPLELAPGAKGLVFRPKRHTVVVRGAAQTAADGPTTDGLSGAQAGATVKAGRLFGGEIRFRGVTASVQLTAEADGTVSQTATSSIGHLVVLGSPVDAPAPGTQVPLADWGTLTIDATAPSDGGLSGARGSSTVAIDVTLTAAHRGLPAGTEIQIGAATAAVTPNTQPAQPPSGRSGGSGSPTHHQSHHHPAPAPAKHHHKPSQSHRAPHAQRAPKRPIVSNPMTLRGSVRQRIVEAAESQIGWPYVWGGESEVEGGFDCSGLVDYAFAAAGRALPGRPTAEVLWMMSQPIRQDTLRPGDLVFLLNRNGYAFHVGLYAGHGRVVVAAHRGAPVALQPLEATPWVAFGRIWERRSVALPPLTHAAPVSQGIAPLRHEPQATASGEAHAARHAPAHQQPGHAHRRHGSRRSGAATVAAREEDLGAAADRPPRGRSA